MCESGHRSNHKSPTTRYLATSPISASDSPIGDDLMAKVYAQGSRFGRLLQKRTLQVTNLDLFGNECVHYDI